MRRLRSSLGHAVAGLSTLAALLAVPLSSAHAQSTSTGQQVVPDASRDREARALFDAGEEAFRAGRYADALDYFRRSHALSGRVALLYNVGVAADRVRRDDEAIEAFERYLRESPATAANRTEVEGRLRALQEVRAQRAAAGTTDAAVTTAAAAPDRTQSGVIANTGDAHTDESARTVAMPEERGGGGRIFTWIALGASVAAVGAGVLVGVLAKSDYDGLIEDCAAKGGCTQSEIDDADLGTRATIANILFAVGGVTLVTGVVLFFVEGGGGGPEEAQVAAGVGPGGLVVRGRF